jgi:hypothetical protein
MNNTEQEYSAEDLAAIKLAREMYLLGNIATAGAVARFARALQDMPKGKDDVQEILRAQILQLQAYAHRAERALRRIGYTYLDGVQEWKPPLGNPPEWLRGDQPNDGNLLLREDGYPHVVAMVDFAKVSAARLFGDDQEREGGKS